MKKVIVLSAALAMMAGATHASTARKSALGNSAAITDVQNIFSNPADIFYVGDFATFEMGETPTTATAATNAVPNAEGGFVRSHGDAKMGMYLGKLSSSTATLRGLANVASATSYLIQENPIEFFYGSKAGDLAWAVSVSYSNSDEKSTGKKQTAQGLRLGVKTDVWAAYANLGLGSTASNTVGAQTAKYTGKSGLELGGNYWFNTMKVYGKYAMNGAKATDIAAGADAMDVDSTEMTVGVVNLHKVDANKFFYGIAYNSSVTDFKKFANPIPTVAADGKKTERSDLLVHFGMEFEANSWLVLRSSLSQNVLMSSNKVLGASADTDTHSTTANAGAGLKWGSNLFDVAFSEAATGTAKTGNFNVDSLGYQAAYTYMF